MNLTIQKLHFPSNAPIANQITVAIYIKPFYPIGGGYSLVASGVLIGIDGTVLSSPPPITTINPAIKYVIKAVNESCGFEYEQVVAVFPYCPTGYQLSGDGTYCYYTIVTNAIPPSAPENSIAVNRLEYSVWGSLIFDPGFNVNGTGPFTQIPYGNSFWVNGVGYPTGGGASPSVGPLNRTGLWSTSSLSNQTIGYAVCINAPVTGTYYVGIAADNFASITLDSDIVVQMDASAISAYVSANGYPGVGLEATFRFWLIYPVTIPAGIHILQVIGTNISSVASMGAEIYNATSAELVAATSYVDLGAKLIFSSKDYIGLPVQLGSDGIGYSCPTDYDLSLCGSPIVCVRTVKTPILY